MKALVYKEFKLAMHPVCYLFVALFPLMILVPDGGYPRAVGFIYVLSCYPILFLGANKGQQSNDLLFSTLLPVRKKDIVMARIITVAVIQFAFMIISCCLLPLAFMIRDSIAAQAASDPKALESITPIGLGIDAYPLILAAAIIGFSLADLIFFPIYYKNGKSIVMSTLLTILGFIIYLGITTILIPYIIGIEKVNSLPLLIQLSVLVASFVVYVPLHYLTYKISANLLEKVDF